MAYLQLIRFPILLLIAAMQVATRYFVIQPILQVNQFDLLMPGPQFWMLVLSTVLIAAGGFSINDYFDAKIDRINKPKSVVLDRLVPRRIAMLLHLILTGAGLALATYMCYSLGMWKMAALFLFAVIALWLYSTNLKHQFLIGNLSIAVMAGFVPLIVGLVEIPMQNFAHRDMIQEMGFSIFNAAAYWVLGYSAMIFFLTLAREITKDVIDVRGDKMFGCKTIPIVMGVRKTKSVILFVYAVLGAALTWLFFSFDLGDSSGLFSAVFLMILLSVASQFGLVFMAKTKRQFLYSVNLNNFSTLLMVLSMYILKLSFESYFA